MAMTFRNIIATASVAIIGWTASATAAPSASVGIISTFAGTGTLNSTGDGGPARNAGLVTPLGVALDVAGNVYIADQLGGRVRKVSAATGIITTVAGNGLVGFSGDGGPATSAQIRYPSGIAVNAAGDLFITDAGNQRVRKVSAASGVITTIAGTGAQGFNGDSIVATSALLQNPSGIAADGAGNVYVVDGGNNRVRKISSASGLISSVAGPIVSGTDVLTPRAIALSNSNALYIAEARRVLRVDLSSNAITILATSSVTGFDGEGHPLASALFRQLDAIAIDGAGNLYFVDSRRVRRADAVTSLVTTLAGNGDVAPLAEGGVATTSGLNNPAGLAVDPNGNLLITDQGIGRVWKVTPPVPTYAIATTAGTGSFGYNGEGIATASAIAHPSGIASDAAGNIYIGDSFNHRIRRVTPAGEISTFAGTGAATFGGDGGPATQAQLYHPEGLAFDRGGNLFVADSVNQRIRRISPSGIITTVAGNGIAGWEGDGGPATSAKLFYPTAVTVDSSGNLFVADLLNNIVRKVDAASGVISTVAGTGTAGLSGDGGQATSARLSQPRGLAIDSSGNLYISDSNGRIRKVNPSGVITTVAGGGNSNIDNVAPTSVFLGRPGGLVLDNAGNLFVTEFGSSVSPGRVRRISFQTNRASIVAGGSTGCVFSGPGLCDDNAPATATRLMNPFAVTIDPSGNLHIADYGADRVRTASPPVVAPATLTLNRYGATGIILNWTAPDGATGYVLKRGTSPGGETPFATVTTNSAYVTGAPRSTNYFTVSALFGATESVNSNEAFITLTPTASRSDIDGDGKSDVLIYRPGTGYWYSRNSASGYVPGAGASTFSWGGAGDTPLQADFDADGKLDPTVYRPSTGQWFAALSSRGYDPSQYRYFAWGASTDTPIAADFDGDGQTDVAVYRPSSGAWHILLSSTGYTIGSGYPTYIVWGGVSGDVPIAADFDADGKADIAYYRAGTWRILYSSFGYNSAASGTYAWGTATDRALPADFDGDGRIDIGVYRPSTGYWYLLLSSFNYAFSAGNWIFQWGAPGDEPKLGDFDGDGLTDITVYRPSTGQWFIRYSSLGYDPAQFGYFEWGATGDSALPQ